jgi:hypothetical protein
VSTGSGPWLRPTRCSPVPSTSDGRWLGGLPWLDVATCRRVAGLVQLLVRAGSVPVLQPWVLDAQLVGQLQQRLVLRVHLVLIARLSRFGWAGGRTDTCGACNLGRAPTDAPRLPCRLRQDLPARVDLCVTGASAAWPSGGRPPVIRGCSMSGEQAVGHPTLDGRQQWPALQAARQAAGPARTAASTPRSATGAPGMPVLTSARSPGPRPSPTHSAGRRPDPTWLASGP